MVEREGVILAQVVVNLVDISWIGVVGLEKRLECVLHWKLRSTPPPGARRTVSLANICTKWSSNSSEWVLAGTRFTIQQPSVVGEIEKLVDVPLRHPITLLLRQESAVGCHPNLCVHLWPQDQLNAVVLVTT